MLAEHRERGVVGVGARKHSQAFDAGCRHDGEYRPLDDAGGGAQLGLLDAQSARLPHPMKLLDPPAFRVPVDHGEHVLHGPDWVVRQQPPVDQRLSPRRRSNLADIDDVDRERKCAACKRARVACQIECTQWIVSFSESGRSWQSLRFLCACRVHHC